MCHPGHQRHGYLITGLPPSWKPHSALNASTHSLASCQEENRIFEAHTAFSLAQSQHVSNGCPDARWFLLWNTAAGYAPHLPGAGRRITAMFTFCGSPTPSCSSVSGPNSSSSVLPSTSSLICAMVSGTLNAWS